MTTLQTLMDEKVKAHGEELEYFRKHQAIFEAALREVLPLNPVRIKAYSRYLMLGITGDKKVLEKVFTALRTAGLNRPENPPEKDSPNWSGFFSKDGADVWVDFTSTVCRRVRTGVQMVEQDVYEIVCGEAS